MFRSCIALIITACFLVIPNTRHQKIEASPAVVPEDDDDITFSHKFFYDSDLTTGDGFVTMTGTLSGPGVGYKNNTTNIACSKNNMTCLVTKVSQIGAHQIARLDFPDSFHIFVWNSLYITSVSADVCIVESITLDRKNKTVLWVKGPITPSLEMCVGSDPKVYKWTVEDSLYWQRHK
jgi:hypothetical protein